MRAAIFAHKGDRQLTVREVPTPEVGPSEVLVKISAAGVNPLDNMIMNGEVRLIVPYRLPVTLGNECVGTVVRTGRGVTRFAEGDRVYGRLPLARIGAFADYAAIAEKALAAVPAYLSDVEAAAVPLTALTAMQALDVLGTRAGETLFIAGGTGSLGAMAIPIAKKRGLTVFTNGSAANAERVTALGADRFIDYQTEDYTAVLTRVDHVLDTLGDREIPREMRILKPSGHLVSLRGMPNGRFARRMGLSLAKRALFGVAGRKLDRLAAKGQRRYDFLFVHADGPQLAAVGALFKSDRLQASVDAVFPLAKVNQALAKVAAGGSRGKTVVTMAP